MNRKKWPDRLKQRFKLVVLNDDTFEERLSFTARGWFILTGALSGALIIIITTIIFIRISPLKEYVVDPVYQPGNNKLIRAYQRMDSLEQLSNANMVYLANLHQVIDGKAGETAKEIQERVRLTSENESPAPEALKKLVGMTGSPDDQADDLSGNIFLRPVNGMLSAGFDAGSSHTAVDIAVRQDEPVKATMDGHVLFAAYTRETGYVLILQHADNLISVYKHCASLFKKVGSFVRKGEVLALAGNTGELSTGPHLHFEIWYKGQAINPSEFIIF